MRLLDQYLFLFIYIMDKLKQLEEMDIELSFQKKQKEVDNLQLLLNEERKNIVKIRERLVTLEKENTRLTKLLKTNKSD